MPRFKYYFKGECPFFSWSDSHIRHSTGFCMPDVRYIWLIFLILGYVGGKQPNTLNFSYSIPKCLVWPVMKQLMFIPGKFSKQFLMESRDLVGSRESEIGTNVMKCKKTLLNMFSVLLPNLMKSCSFFCFILSSSSSSFLRLTGWSE